MAEHHNVSVRLNETDYKQLLFLHDKFNRMSYGKVSLADVLRIAVKELYLIESKEEDTPVTKQDNSGLEQNDQNEAPEETEQKTPVTPKQKRKAN